MNIRLSLVLGLLVSCAGFAQARSMHYLVDLRHTETHSVHVTMTPEGFRAKEATFQMPIWAPGAYSVTHYGRYVSNFRALDRSGKPLEVKQVNDDRWTIAKGDKLAKIEYDVLDSHKDTTSLYFAMANMDTSLFFANATALFGYYDDDKNASATVDYNIPQGWKLACALADENPNAVAINAPSSYPPAFNKTHFNAKDYDQLADAPIIAAPGDAAENSNHLVTGTFNVGSASYDVALATSGTFPPQKMDSLTTYLAKIVHAETDFFHDTPFKHYTFIIYAPTMSHIPSMAMGALEHANSSDYLIGNFGWSMFKGAFLSIFSHEFFHLWNVKRIHSSLLGPFDYTSRVMTTSLWLSEGITEYYANTLMARYGIWTPERFYSSIGQWLMAYQNAPASAKAKSLEQLSIDESAFDLDEAEIFYTKGPLVGMMLDLEIRTKTNNKKSLDDVMFALYNDAKHGKHFRDEDLIHQFEKYSGVDLTDFYNRYIHGTRELPLQRYLAMMGLRQDVDTTDGYRGRSKIAITGPMNDNARVLTVVDSSTALAKAGVQAGDTLLTINGEAPDEDNLSVLFYTADTIRVGVEHEGAKRVLTVAPLPPADSIHGFQMDPIVEIPNASQEAIDIRRAIVGAH